MRAGEVQSVETSVKASLWSAVQAKMKAGGGMMMSKMKAGGGVKKKARG